MNSLLQQYQIYALIYSQWDHHNICSKFTPKIKCHLWMIDTATQVRYLFGEMNFRLVALLSVLAAFSLLQFCPWKAQNGITRTHGKSSLATKMRESDQKIQKYSRHTAATVAHIFHNLSAIDPPTTFGFVHGLQNTYRSVLCVHKNSTSAVN